MKKLKLQSVLCFALCMVTFGAKAQSPTAPALGFNMMVENNAQFNSSEMEGPLAIGKNLTIAGDYSVNSHDKGTYEVGNVLISLVVNGEVNYNSGNSFKIQNGYLKIRDSGTSKVWYHDPNNATPPIRITKNSSYNSSPRIELQQSAPSLGVSATVNPVFDSTNINFDSAFLAFQSNAQSLSSCTDNTILKNSNGALLGRTNLPNQVKIYLHSGANILNIDGSELNNIQDFIFQNTQPDSAHFLIINVNNPGTFNWDVYNSGSFGGTTNCQYILYNFYNADNVTITGNSAAVEGTIFAPYADVVKNNSSNIEGQVIAKSYDQTGGGEVHYAPFLPDYSGCSTPPTVTPTHSAFTITNDSEQCLGGNTFAFSNQSTGSGTLSYLWNFGDSTTDTAANPTKVYALPDTYIVKLIVTGTGGADTSSRIVIVHPLPVDSIVVDTNMASLSTNSFHFTASPITPGFTYQWDFGDTTSSTLANPTKSYTEAGIYNVSMITTNPYGCSDTSYQTVYVTSDSVGTGHNGGLESHSLGGLVGKRDFNRMKYSIPSSIDYAKMPVFNNIQERPTGGAPTLEDIVPTYLAPDMVLRVSTPEDILSLTSAKDVFSVDYTLDNRAKAVVLGIETLNKAYSHTKSTCDRFRGSTLLRVDSVNINGFPFIRFMLKNKDGIVEYAIAFVVGQSKGQNYYSLQTNWLISNYQAADTLYNMQVWSMRPDYTNKLVSDILNRLESYQSVQLTNTSATPAAYVTYGERVKGDLVVAVDNTTNQTSGELVFQERKNEQAGIDVLRIPLQLVKGENNVFDVPVKDGYEYQGSLYLNDSLVDEVYMADGNWGVDYDNRYTSIEQYTIGNNPNRVYSDDEYPIYRSSDIKVKTTDYITVYKAISSGTEPTDLSAYKSLKFTASGSGDVIIRLTKASIADWNSQYQFTLHLTNQPTEYAISLSDFKSTQIKDQFDPNDLKTVSFSMLDKSGAEEDLSLYVGDMVFSTDSVMSILALRSTQLTISPNPSSGIFKCKFASATNTTLELKVADITGRTIFTQEVQAVKGYNNIVNVHISTPPGVFIVTLEGKDIKYDAQKLVINK